MVELVCPVRGCSKPLERAERVLRCAAGHTFNITRHGTCALLQPQDRRSLRPGDADASVEARRRWVESGHADGLLCELDVLVGGLDRGRGSVVLDVGCGDAYLTARLANARGWELCGIDLSAKALRIAAQTMPGATWLRANADRRLPLATGSVDLVLSLFGRRNAAELRRVLRATGNLVVVVPGSDDLIELREAVLGEGVSLERAAKVITDLEPTFTLGAHRSWREVTLLDPPAIADALAMTYRGARRREAERAQHLGPLSVTLSAELLSFGVA